MRKMRAVALTALAATAAIVVAACGSTPGQQTTTSNNAGGTTTQAGATTTENGGGSQSPQSSGSQGSTQPSGGSGPQASPTDGCGIPHGPYTDPGAPSGSVNTGSAELATSWNNVTSHGNSVYNANPTYLTQAQMYYYDKDLNVINNDQFIKCEVTSKDPLTVKYTINADAKWSDGVPITAADMIMFWGAQNGAYNTGEVKTDENGNPIKQDNVVAFDAQSQGLALITKFPEGDPNGKTLTVVYDQPFVDYQLNFGPALLPAHVVGAKALGDTDPAKAAADVVDAFKNKDNSKLAKVANFWNTGFDFTSLPSDKSLYLSSGAYLLTDFQDGKFMTFKANPNYTWGPKPTIETITYQFLPDATAAIQAMSNGELQFFEPEHPTADTTKGLAALSDSGVKTVIGASGSYEHVDLVFANGGPFDPKTYGGDQAKATKVAQAFLKTIPRQDIVDRLIKPMDPNATVRDSFTQVPGSPWYEKMTSTNGMNAYDKVDIEGAKKLLQEAGVSNLKVRFLYSSTNPVRVQEYQLIAASAKQAGIDVVDGKDPKWSSNLPNISKYDASLFGWINTNLGIAQIPPNYLGKDSVSKDWGQNNYGKFNNAQVNKDMTALNVEADPAKQLPLIQSTEKLLVDNGFGTILYQTPDIVGYDSNKITNISSIPCSPGVFYNFWEWKLAG